MSAVIANFFIGSSAPAPVPVAAEKAAVVATKVIIGGVGNDSLTGTDAADSMDGQAGNDTLRGGNGNDTLLGGTDKDQLYGDAGNDVLDGGSGADSMWGGLGDDTYVIDNVGDVITEAANGGWEWVYSDVSYTLGENVENLALRGNLAINGTGNSANNVIWGSYGNNILNGAAGADVMIGRTGDDIYYVDNAGDVVTENVGEGTDTIYSSVGLTMPQNVENLTLIGAANVRVDGNEAANVMTANNAGSTLVGLGGNDTLIGGAGDDFLYGGAGNDWVEGGNWHDLLSGSDGNDTLKGGDLSDTLYGDAGNDLLDGGQSIDVMYAGDGNDTLIGGDSRDTMYGGGGNDTYVNVENIDDIWEYDDNGFDTIITNEKDYALYRSIEQLVLGDLNEKATGTEFNNFIVGGNAAQQIWAIGGNDTIYGSGGNDTLYGGTGRDVFAFDRLNNGRSIGRDTIADFEIGSSGDKIKITGFDLKSFANVLAKAQETGTGDKFGTKIDLSLSESVFLLGIKKTQLTADNFLFG